MTSPLSLFLLQLLVIVIVCQLFGYLFKKAGQPRVMGEMVAGIVLGPSVAGALAPGFSASLFPAASLGSLQLLSQVGLVLFMFVIGMEVDAQMLKTRAKAAATIAGGSIIIPFALGTALSYFLYREYAGAHIPYYQFALFMGIAMSITAFPVLARIIRERGMMNSRLGTMALLCAGMNDVAGWCLLALVVALVKADGTGSALITLGATTAYVVVMLLVIRPVLERVCRGEWMGRNPAMALLFITMVASAWVCEAIGIHALFGAFLAGIVMPERSEIRKRMIGNIEHVALVLLLPLFFVFTGLRTQIGLLNNWHGAGICALIIAIAVAGKVGGSALAGRLAGETGSDSLAIGVLMNTRGLMELVVLNIGYELGILKEEIFTMMVIMAIITTLMTGPLLNRLTTRNRPDPARQR